jgi:dolichol kinase
MKNKKTNELVGCDCEGRKYPVKVGKSVASSLAGFIAGFIVGTIGWAAIIYMLKPFCN